MLYRARKRHSPNTSSSDLYRGSLSSWSLGYTPTVTHPPLSSTSYPLKPLDSPPSLPPHSSPSLWSSSLGLGSPSSSPPPLPTPPLPSSSPPPLPTPPSPSSSPPPLPTPPSPSPHPLQTFIDDGQLNKLKNWWQQYGSDKIWNIWNYVSFALFLKCVSEQLSTVASEFSSTIEAYKKTPAGRELLNIANRWFTRGHRFIECGVDVGVPLVHTYATFKFVIKMSGMTDVDAMEVEIRQDLIEYIIRKTSSSK